MNSGEVRLNVHLNFCNRFPLAAREASDLAGQGREADSAEEEHDEYEQTAPDEVDGDHDGRVGELIDVALYGAVHADLRLGTSTGGANTNIAEHSRLYWILGLLMEARDGSLVFFSYFPPSSSSVLVIGAITEKLIICSGLILVYLSNFAGEFCKL